MTRHLLFIQGGGAGVHDDWDAALVESLRAELGPAYEIDYPRMPGEEDPHYAAWKSAIETHLSALDDRAILLGHSLGGAVLVNVLVQLPVPVGFGALFLVAAPFVGEGGWSSDELTTPADLGARLPEDLPVHVYHGLQDETAPAIHADLYARAVPHASIHLLPGRDHQLDNDMREVAAAIKAYDVEAYPR